LTLSWSFQKSLSRYPLRNKSVQLTRRNPLFVHLLAKSTSSLPRYFPCFTCYRKPVSMFVFCRASAGASTARILSLTYHFVFGFTFPICGSTLPQPKQNTKTTQIHLKFYFRTTAHTGIARSRGMNVRCAENVRVSNRGHRPQWSREKSISLYLTQTLLRIQNVFDMSVNHRHTTC